MVWTAVIFVIGCDDKSYVCSILGIGVLSGNLFFSILCMVVFLKAFDKKHHLVEKIRSIRSSSLHDGASSNNTVVDQDAVGSWTSTMEEGVVYVNPCCPAASEVEMVAVSGLSDSAASRSSSSLSSNESSSKKRDDEFDLPEFGSRHTADLHTQSRVSSLNLMKKKRRR